MKYRLIKQLKLRLKLIIILGLNARHFFWWQRWVNYSKHHEVVSIFQQNPWLHSFY